MAFLTAKNLEQEYNLANGIQQTVTSYFSEYERIFRGLPAHQSAVSGLPDVAEQTYQKIITELPARLLPEVPEIDVESASGATECVVEDYMNRKILPNAKYAAPPLHKLHHVIRSMGNYGVQFAMVVHKQLPNGDYGIDFDVPYMGDVLIEKGARTAYLANYIFIKQYYTHAGIKNLIETETRKKQSIWNIGALKKVLEAYVAKSASSLTVDDVRSTNVDQGEHIEIIRAFQRGKNAWQYYFSTESGGRVLAKEKLPDLQGEIPLVPFYYDLNFSNPYGWGLAERMMGQQNQNDIIKALQYRSNVYGLAPAVSVSGTVQEGEVALTPDNIIPLGADPDSKINVLTADTYFHRTYAQDMAIQRQTMHDLAGAPTPGGGAESGFADSKVSAGVKLAASKVSIADRARREHFRVAFSELCTMMLRMLILNRHGKEKITVPREVANKLANYEYNPHKVSFNKKGRAQVAIDWDVVKDEFENSGMRFTTEWEFDRREQAGNMERALNTYLRDRRLDGTINWRGYAIELARLNGIDWRKIVKERGEDPEQQRLTLANVEQLIDEKINQSKAEQGQEDSMARIYQWLPEEIKAQYHEEQGYQMQTPSIPKQEVDVKAAKVNQDGGDVELPQANPETVQEGTPQQQAKAALVERAIQEKVGNEGLAELMRTADALDDASTTPGITDEQRAQLAQGAGEEFDNIFNKYRGKGEVSLE